MTVEATTDLPIAPPSWWDWLRWAAALAFNGLAAFFWALFGAGAAASGGHPEGEFLVLCAAAAAVPAVVSAGLAFGRRIEWAIASAFATIPALVVGMLLFAGLGR
jgi:hypothetical protein